MNAIVAIGGPALFRVVDAYRARIPSDVWVLGLQTPRDAGNPALRSLEALLEPFMESYFAGEAQAAFDAIIADSTLHPALGEALDPPRVSGVLQAALAHGVAPAYALVEMLDRANALTPFDFVVTDDTSSPARTAIAWARARRTPVFTVADGAPLRRPAVPRADCTFVAGAHGRRAYRAAGIDDALLAFVDPPDPAARSAPEELSVRRSAARAALTQALGWTPADIVVLFEPAATRESILEPADPVGSSLALMFAAFRAARAIVPVLRLAVVAAPSPDGLARAGQLAAAAGVADGEFAFAQTDRDVWIAGADIAVGVDSMLAIDASAFGIPAVNLWRASDWLRGPAYGAEDGIVAVMPQNLGATLIALAQNPDTCAQIGAIGSGRLLCRASGTAAGAIAAELIVRRRPSAPSLHKARPDIVVWAPGYSHASGGIRALFRLCHLINLAGGDAWMYGPTALHPTWNAPLRDKPITDRTIVIIPEIVFGHPAVKRIVRWVLNKPGLLGGPTTYAPDEMVFYYAQAFRAAAQAATPEALGDERELAVATMEPDLFYNDRSRRRLYDLVYIGKGQALYERVQPRQIRDALVIRRAATVWPQSRIDTAALLRGCRRFYSFDANTAIVMEAEVCGAQALYVRENGELEEDKHDVALLSQFTRDYFKIDHIERFLRLISERWV